MAKAEFYEIVIRDKKEQVVLNNVSLNNVISGYLNKNSDNENFCQNKNCAVILNSHIVKSENDMTFDFAKLTDEKVISTLISKPSEGEDTFKEYHKKILETTTYTTKEKKEIERIISLKTNEDLIDELKKISMDEFKIYKIILENNFLQDEELHMFENKIIKRLKKDSIYFNIVEKLENSDHKLLIYQNLTDGLDIRFLENYLNTHLLIGENFKVYFHKLYDADFMDLLYNGDLNSFMFSYSIESKNNLLDQNLFGPLYILGDMFGKNTTKVEIKPKKDEILNNELLIDFFVKASDSGFLDTCELKQKGGGNRKIDFKNKKLNIEYTENISIDNINDATLFFEKALKKKISIVKKRLGL